jgi:hypothetical protein
VIPELYSLDNQAVLGIRDAYPGFWFISIPDPGSRILDPGSGSWISDPGSRILDPTTATKEESENFFVVLPFLATNITKLKIIYF